MLVRERERSGTLTDFSVCFELLLTYRVPMKVDEVVVFFPWNQEDIYYRSGARSTSNRSTRSNGSSKAP